MSKYYEKSTGRGEKFLYDSSGKCIGRGVTDKNGKTIYSGAGGYIGKSYTTPSGTVKHYDSNNNFVGTGLNRSGVSPIIGNDSSPSNSSHYTSNEGHFRPCAAPRVLPRKQGGWSNSPSPFSHTGDSGRTDTAGQAG